MPESITPSRTRRLPLGRYDMNFAVRLTGLTRQTLMKASKSDEIAGAKQIGDKANTPWTFTLRGLCDYAGIDIAEAEALAEAWATEAVAS